MLRLAEFSYGPPWRWALRPRSLCCHNAFTVELLSGSASSGGLSVTRNADLFTREGRADEG